MQGLGRALALIDLIETFLFFGASFFRSDRVAVFRIAQHNTRPLLKLHVLALVMKLRTTKGRPPGALLQAVSEPHPIE